MFSELSLSSVNFAISRAALVAVIPAATFMPLFCHVDERQTKNGSHYRNAGSVALNVAWRVQFQWEIASAKRPRTAFCGIKRTDLREAQDT
jgi:hypothetical protein